MKPAAIRSIVFVLTFFGAPRAHALPPQVTNGRGASSVHDVSATLNGELIGKADATASDVRVCWGLTDGGTIESAWFYRVRFARLRPGPFSTDLSGLVPNTTYYYRCMVRTGADAIWAPASASFKTYPTGRASAPYIWRTGAPAALARADLVYAEMMVEKTERGGYYCSILGDGFYMGLQHGGAGYNKHVHFSVWDPCGDIPWKAADVVAQRFGGEGTGWATYWPFEWQLHVPYRLCVRFTPRGSDTLYDAYFFDPSQAAWKHLVTILRNVPDAHPNSFGSFNEDFGEQNWAARSYLVGNEWLHTTDGRWVDLFQGRFEVALGWATEKAFDAGVNDVWFRLETGGDTVQHTPLHTLLLRQAGTRPTVVPSETDPEPRDPDVSPRSLDPSRP